MSVTVSNLDLFGNTKDCILESLKMMLLSIKSSSNAQFKESDPVG